MKASKIISIVFRSLVLIPSFVFAFSGFVDHDYLVGLWFLALTLFCTADAQNFKARTKVDYHIVLLVIAILSAVGLNYLLENGYVST